MLKKFKTLNKNQQKKSILYLALLISNILLFIGLISNFPKFGITININSFEDIAAIIAAMIILGFISSKLYKIRDMGENAFYGFVYFIIICVIGIMSSYFNGKVNTSAHFDPYLEMFKILCAVLIFVIIAANFTSFKKVLYGKDTQRNRIICLIIFILIGLFASYARVTVNGTPANIRCLIVMISGLFGGPFIGLPVGIISGAYRFTLGGVTALPCAISTVISGVVGSLIYIWNDRKFPGTRECLTVMFLFTGFEMLVVLLLTPPEISFPFIWSIYPLMLFASVIGMLIFSIVIQELREQASPKLSSEHKKIVELENKLEKYSEKLEELKGEIKELRDEDSSDDE